MIRWSQNMQGRRYVRGQGDPTLWHQVAASQEREPHLKGKQLAERLHVAESTVSRIKKKLKEGKTEPEPTGKASSSYNQFRKMQEEHLASLVDLMPGASLQRLRQYVPRTPTTNYSLSHVCRLLNKYKLTRKTPLYFHPNKWKGDNPQYYEEYLLWVMEQPIEVRSRFKFFDEVRVDSRDLFKTKLRGRERRLVQKSRMPTDEVFTINCLTLLDSDPPLIWNAIPGSSNGQRYIEFWLYCAYACLRPGDVVLADNAHFHAKGYPAEFVRDFLRSIGVEYILLPKYSPELNPVELVFSMLKRMLNAVEDTTEVLNHVAAALAKIRPHHILAFYSKRGYL